MNKEEFLDGGRWKSFPESYFSFSLLLNPPIHDEQEKVTFQQQPKETSPVLRTNKRKINKQKYAKQQTHLGEEEEQEEKPERGEDPSW